MIVIIESLVETLDVPDKDLTLPFFRSDERVFVMAEQEGELHATGVKDALIALSSHVLASCVTENGIGEHR